MVKHSQPVVDPKVPPREWELSGEGVRRCNPLAEKLQLFDLPMIYASYETKATQTAAYAANQLRIPWENFPNLHEQDSGKESTLIDLTAFQSKVKDLFDRKDELVYGVETGRQAANRFAQALDRLITTSSQDLCLVTHGRVMCLFLAERCKADGFALWSRLGLPAIVTLDLEEFQIREIYEIID